MTARDRSGNLTARQQSAVRALLAGGTAAMAATASGVSERTVRRWLATGVLAGPLRDAARHVAAEATTSLLAAQGEAVATLRAAMRSGLPAVRVRAAVAVLEFGRIASDDDVEGRITGIEERMRSWQDDAATGSDWKRWSA